MQKQVNKLKSLYNEIIELIILEDFSQIISKIKIIKQIISNIENNLNNSNKTEKKSDKSHYKKLEEDIKNLEERILKLEKFKNPSMQIRNKDTESNNGIWD